MNEDSKSVRNYMYILARLHRQRHEIDVLINEIKILSAHHHRFEVATFDQSPPLLRGMSVYRAVIALLNDAGRPMTTDELKRGLAAGGCPYTINGLYKTVKVRQHCEIIRPGKAVWALLE